MLQCDVLSPIPSPLTLHPMACLAGAPVERGALTWSVAGHHVKGVIRLRVLEAMCTGEPAGDVSCTGPISHLLRVCSTNALLS